MKKNTSKKLGANNQQVFQDISLHGLLQWKAKKILELGVRIVKCIIALDKYDIVLGDQEIHNLIYNDKTFTLKSKIMLEEMQVDISRDALYECFCLVKGKKENERLRLSAIDEHFRFVRNALKMKMAWRQYLHLLSATCMVLYYSKDKAKQAHEIGTFFELEHHLTKQSCEAIGYASAKLEEMKRNKINPENKGKVNKDAIKKVLEDLNITSLSAFRGDKDLRIRFYEMAKEATKAVDKKHDQELSPKRIADLAREILK